MFQIWVVVFDRTVDGIQTVTCYGRDSHSAAYMMASRLSAEFPDAIIHVRQLKAATI